MAHKATLEALLRQHGGRFLSVTFQKLDGTPRTVNCKVRNFRKVLPRGVLVTLMEAGTQEWKSLYADRILSVRLDNMQFICKEAV